MVVDGIVIFVITGPFFVSVVASELAPRAVCLVIV